MVGASGWLALIPTLLLSTALVFNFCNCLRYRYFLMVRNVFASILEILTKLLKVSAGLYLISITCYEELGRKNLNSLVHSILLRGITKSLWTRILRDFATYRITTAYYDSSFIARLATIQGAEKCRLITIAMYSHHSSTEGISENGFQLVQYRGAYSSTLFSGYPR